MATEKKQALAVQVTRGSEVESEHIVDVVVLDQQGRLVKSWGEPERPVYPRSAIKFAQATLLAEKVNFEKWHLSERHLALACSSHRAEAQHVNLVDEWLQAMGLSVADLECGPHYPGEREMEIKLIEQGRLPDARHNNCSGKHCGLLNVCLEKALPTKHYSDYKHPLQQMLRQTLSELGSVDYQKLPWALDGCQIPTYRISLEVLARTLGHFLPSAVAPVGLQAKAQQKILKSVQSQPFLLGGQRSLSSVVTALTKGQVVAKTGAEGVFTLLFLQEKLSVALKVRDGATRASEATVIHLLKEFSPSSIALESEIFKTHPQILKNWSQSNVGKVVVQDSVAF